MAIILDYIPKLLYFCNVYKIINYEIYKKKTS